MEQNIIKKSRSCLKNMKYKCKRNMSDRCLIYAILSFRFGGVWKDEKSLKQIVVISRLTLALPNYTYTNCVYFKLQRVFQNRYTCRISLFSPAKTKRQNVIMQPPCVSYKQAININESNANTIQLWIKQICSCINMIW